MLRDDTKEAVFNKKWEKLTKDTNRTLEASVPDFEHKT